MDIATLLALTGRRRGSAVGVHHHDASAARGDFDIGLSGMEDTAARRRRLALTVPYYEFREVMTVRQADAPRFRTLTDLAGRRVGTLGSTLAFDILQQEGQSLALVVVPYENDVHPYSDLALGRLTPWCSTRCAERAVSAESRPFTRRLSSALAVRRHPRAGGGGFARPIDLI